jgi:hypothetical protein
MFTSSSRRAAPNLACLVLETRKRAQEGHNPDKLSWVRFLVKMVSVTRKLSTIKKDSRNKIVCFGEEITGTKITNPKTVLGSSLGKDVGFRVNFFL